MKHFTAYILGALPIGCVTKSSTTEDTGSQTTSTPAPQCLLDDVPQTSKWNRLGTPASLTLTNQFAPSLVVYNSELWLYYSQREQLTDTVMLIRSTDGASWSSPETIASLSDFSDIMHMNVSTQDDGLVSYIGGGRIGQVQSSDGYNWETVGTLLVPTADFDTYGQLYPALSSDGSQLWFSGFNGQSYSIGKASLNNGSWENQGVILEADTSSDYENRAVAQLSIFESEDGYLAWYGGYDTSQTDPGPWRILWASSEDGNTWTNRQLALDLEETGEEAWSVREPSVALFENTLWMAYIAMGDDGEYRLRIASCE